MTENNEFSFVASQKEFFGVLKGGFLAKSIGSLNPHKPMSINEQQTVKDALSLFQQHKIGSILITNNVGNVSGIFTERDFLLKCAGNNEALAWNITDVMTKDPVCQTVEATIAFVISLMVHGGFRHIPVIDQDGKPVGIISVKDIMAAIGQQFLDDIEQIEV